jgi:acetoacetyl-CoA synthetase
MPAVMTKPLWQPSAQAIAASNMQAFMRAAGARHGRQFDDYDALYAWSIAEPEQFWREVWSFCGVVADSPGNVTVEHRERMPGARWFPQARLNFAENLLRRRDGAAAIVFWGEDRVQSSVTFAELHQEVSRLAQALRHCGVKAGDRVAAYLPNIPGAVIAMLAAASIGAVWSSCSPDFGVQGVLDRFGQIEPKILFAADGYFYNGKTIDVLPRVAEIVAALPSLERVIMIPYTQRAPDLGEIPRCIDVNALMAPFKPRTIEFERLPFNHPLYILYSSGTTGVPKCIVHGAGGTLLQHLKEHVLHVGVGRDDRVFYFTTLGWMMWNWQVTALAAGATLLLYDGSPFARGGNIVFDFADATGMTVLGTSAKFIDALAKNNLRPRKTHRLDTLRAILSTGSPLVPEGFDYVYEHIKQDVNLASMSGGTDIIACFVNGNPILPVWRGEIQCRALGMKVEVYDDSGQSVQGAKGELVCTASFPSMPVGFWNDADGAKYRAAYFEQYPNVWRHGDYVELTERGGMIIYGRSDAVLNPGGVRIGTAEIYRQVEKLDEVVESLVIGQDWPPQQPTDVRIVLFVRLREGRILDDALAEKIRQQIRANTTIRHVPAKVLQVTDIPRTKSGKIVELAVRNIVHGRAIKNIEALANPEALALFRDRPELAT